MSNFFDNLGDVPNLLNNLAQLKGKAAMETTARLLFNTTFGVLGLWDPATRMGLHKRSEDFGQTLGFYGVGSGPTWCCRSSARPTCATPADWWWTTSANTR